MAITTNNNYKSPKKNMPVIKMSRGGEVSSMDYSERMEYIKNEILPKVSNTIKTFNIYSSGFSYDMNQDYKKTYEEIRNNYKSISDYDENSLDENTIYSVDGWEILRKEIDPDTNDVIDTQELEMVESGNTYNHIYLGLVDVNFRIYQDEEYGKYILIMHTHIGGDIRGNYDDALILIGDDKDELLYKFYEEFLNGVCTLILNFKDGSSLTFDSTQDSDIFNFEYIDEDDLEEGSTAHHVLKDFQSLSGYDADEFIENINNQFPESSTKMVSGGEIHDDRPQAYIQILGYPEGKLLDLTEFSNGSEVIDYITQWMNDLNEKTGGNREEYEVADYEGFGNIMFSQYMGETDFDEILEAYKEFENTDFPNEVVEQYFKDLGFKELTEVIGSMESNYYGRFDSNSDFAYEMVENESYVASERDMFVTDTDKRIIAGEEADNYTNYMDFEELLENSPNTKEKYEEEKDVLEYALDNASEYEYDKIIEEIDNLEEKYKSLAYEEVYDNHYESVYNKLENDLQDYLEEMGMNPNDASFVSIDYNKVADELMDDFHLIENNGDYYFFYAYKNGGKVSYINKPSKNNTHYVIELSLGKIVSGWENRDSAEEDRKALIMKYPKYKFGIYKKDKLKEKYNFDTITYNDFIDLSKIALEQEEDEKMNKSTKASLKNITHNKKSKSDNKVVNKEIEELNEKIYSKLKELLGSISKDGEEKTEKIFQEIKELTKKKDRLAISHFQSTGYMYARGGRTRKLKKYFKRGKIGVNKALNYSREKYYQASDYAEKKDLKGKIKRGAYKVLDKTKQGASWLQRQFRDADFGDGKGKAKFFADGGGVSGNENLIVYFESGNDESSIYRITKLSGEELYASWFGSSATKEIIELIDRLETKYSKFIFDNDNYDSMYYGVIVINDGTIEEYNTSTDKWLNKKRELGLEKFEKGGKTISQTPAPKKDQIKGSSVNKEGSSKDLKSASKLKFSDDVIETLKTKVEEHNSKYPKKKITLDSAKAVLSRGMGAFSTSYRPTIGGGKKNSRVAWGLARLNAFIYKIINGTSKSGKYSQDNDLIEELGYKVQKFDDGGALKVGSKVGYNVNDVVQLKNIPENYPYEIRNGIVNNKWKIVRVSKGGRSMYDNIMEDIFGYDIELLDTKIKYKAFVYFDEVKMYNKYENGGGVEKSIRGFKVGDLFYITPSTSGNKRYYKITSIDNYDVKADDYDYVLNGTDVNTGRKSSFTTGSFGFMFDEHEISRYEKGDLGYAKGGVLKVGSKVGFLRPRTGRYEYAEVLSIDGDNVNLVVRHPKRSQWDNYFTETKERITQFSNTFSEDYDRPVMKVKFAGGGVAIYKETDLNRRDGKTKIVQVTTENSYREALERIEELKNKNKNPNVRFFTGDIYRYADGGGVEPYDEEKYSSEYDYLKKIITKIFGEKNTNYSSADWGGIDNWTIQGDMYEGVFIIIDDDRKVILMERKYNEELEENEDTDILYAEANDKSALQKLFNMASKIKYPLNKYAHGGDTEKVYIEFLNKEKGFKKDTKYFNSYEEAVKWARKNLEKFNSDMIKYKYSDGGEMQEEKFRYKDFYQSQGGIKFKTEEEAERFIKTTKPFVRKQLREGNFVLVFNGKEYFIGEKIKINDEYADGETSKKKTI